MTSIQILYLAISIIFLFFSYLFTLIESAYLYMNPLKLKKFEELNLKNIKYIEKNYENKNHIYSSALILDYFSNLTCAIFLSQFFKSIYPKYGILIGLFLATFLILIFGELIPQTIGKKKFDGIVNKFSVFIHNVSLIFKPIVLLISFISTFIINLRGGNKDYTEPLITEDDLIHAFELGHQEGIIDHNEMGFIENVMEFRDTLAKDIMTPRTDIIAIDINSTYEEIVNLITEEGFSRIPVYENDLDNILGILHVKDLFSYSNNPTELDLKSILRQSFLTFEYKPISKLFNEMRAKKVSVAMVLDEYGGTEGMITTEDLIEKIVGAISDEYDEDEDEDIIQINSREFLIEGSTNISLINHELDLSLQSDEFDTIAGYIIENIDRFPKKGEKIAIGEIEFFIKETSKNRIDKIILKK